MFCVCLLDKFHTLLLYLYSRRVVAGQRRRMLNEQQTTGMLSFAGLKPQERAGYLQEVMQREDLGGFNSGELGTTQWVWWCVGHVLGPRTPAVSGLGRVNRKVQVCLQPIC